jgi:DNA-binding XRE family transcriptional regulator
MVTPDIDKRTCKELRKERSLSMSKLASLADVSVSAIRNLEDPNFKCRTSFGVALRVAEALGVEIHEVRWLRGLSNEGRPVGTGCSIRSAPTLPQPIKCTVHNIVLPTTGICDDCSS